MVRRLAQGLVLLLLVSVVVFLLLHIVPGDPALLILGPTARTQDVAALNAQLGLNDPLPVQYVRFLGGLFQGDLGDSIRARRPVAELIGIALPPTLQLTGAALALSCLVGVPLGVLAALRPGGIGDRLALLIALLGQSVPAFWLGMMLISLVSMRWGLLPTSGYGTWRHLILPTLALAPLGLGMTMRISRIGMLEALGEDYVRTARAKGVRASLVVAKHALRNAAIPILTIMGLQVGALVGGAVITETIFAWPGMGQLAVSSLINRDYPVVQGVVLMAALAVILINLLVDLTYALIDRRVQYR